MSLFLDDCFPSASNAALHALVSGTFLGMGFQCPIRFLSTAMWDLETIPQSNLRDLEYAVYVLDVTFDISHQIARRLDLPHIQCSP